MRKCQTKNNASIQLYFLIILCRMLTFLNPVPGGTPTEHTLEVCLIRKSWKRYTVVLVCLQEQGWETLGSLRGQQDF